MQKFDVVIIGNGITALSTAWHLALNGIDHIAVVAPAKKFTQNLARLNFGSVTFFDNISRIVHNHGVIKTKELLKLNLYGFKQLQHFLKQHQIKHSIGNTVRISESQHETTEMKHAINWLEQFGYPATLRTDLASTIQHDGSASILVDYQSLLEKLNETAKITVINDRVTNIHSVSGLETLTLNSGNKLNTEMIVLACHTSIKNLIPEMENTLVNYADQKIEFDIISKSNSLSAGDLIFSNHSQFWAVKLNSKKLLCGGARFMRKWAGIEATIAEATQQITDCVQAKFEKILKLKLSPTNKPIGFLDIRPCDEMPVIGPMYGNTRILIATGYMGSGLTLGYAAGHGIAEFIATGKSKLIPEFLHPKRFRSLPENYDSTEIKD